MFAEAKRSCSLKLQQAGRQARALQKRICVHERVFHCRVQRREGGMSMGMFTERCHQCFGMLHSQLCADERVCCACQ
jgi:hypothetical protein